MEEIILGAFEDSLSDFFYYDRKADDELTTEVLYDYCMSHPELLEKLMAQLTKTFEVVADTK